LPRFCSEHARTPVDAGAPRTCRENVLIVERFKGTNGAELQMSLTGEMDVRALLISLPPASTGLWPGVSVNLYRQFTNLKLIIHYKNSRAEGQKIPKTERFQRIAVRRLPKYGNAIFNRLCLTSGPVDHYFARLIS
jgi:hypothetical protein